MASLGPHHSGHHQFLAGVVFRVRLRISTFPAALRHRWLDLAVDPLAIVALGADQIVVQLEAESEAGRERNFEF